MRTLFRPCLELLGTRRVLASITGAIAVDTDGDHIFGANDVPVANGFVWLDVNKNGRYEQGEPAEFSGSDGTYLFENVVPGEVLVRMMPTAGLVQTFPYEHFAMQYDAAGDDYGLAKLDSISGIVSPLGASNGANRNGLIKTVAGEYYATGHVFDSLFKIDALTGEQTLVGHLGQEVVGGLAYDPVMDEIYTLARPSDQGDPVAALRLFKVDRTSATLIPVSDIEPSIDGIRFTTSLAFDWVHRQVVLFDNATNTAYAYDLHGEIRQLGVFKPADRFYNLAFDGFRFLTHRIVDGQGVLFRVDPEQGTLTELTQLSAPLSVNAGDRLSNNEPHRLDVLAAESQFVGINFLTTKLTVDSAQLHVTSERLQVFSQSQALDISASMGDGLTELRFCVAGNTGVDLQFSDSSTQPFRIELGDGQDRLSLDQAAFDAWPNLSVDLGTSHDALILAASESFDVMSVTDRLRGVDEIEVSGIATTSILIDENSVASISDKNSLAIRMGSEDEFQLSDEAWFSRGVDIANDQRMHAIATDHVLVSLRNGTLWHNPLNALDVNFDGVVSPIDALVIINLVNRAGGSQLHEAVPAFLAAAYVDTNADNALSPLDALLVINALNKP